MKLKTISLFIVLPLLFISCTSNNQVNVNKIKKVKDNTPNWILNPNKQNHICSIGSAPITDKKTTNTIARMKAKSNLSKQISIYIDSQSKSMRNSNGKSKYTSSSSQQSTNMLKNIKFTDNYTDSTNNRYYIRACSKI